MYSKSSLRNFLAFGLVLCFCLAITPGFTQASAASPAAVGQDNVLWWTLTDSISPGELKAVWEDETLHRERYLQAVEEGTRPPLSEEKLQHLTSFFTGQSTPELIPLWRAFSAYSTHFDGESRSRIDEKARMLEAHGFDRSTAEFIVHQALGQLDRSQEIVSKVKDEAWRFVELKQVAERRMGPEAAKRAVARGDAVSIGVATSTRSSDVQKWMDAWNRRPAREVAVDKLVLMKERLSRDEWQLLRSYLLEDVAPMMSTIDFAEVE